MNIKQTIITVVAILLVGVLFLNYWDNDKQIQAKEFKSKTEQKMKEMSKTRLDYLWTLDIDPDTEIRKEKDQFRKEQKFKHKQNLLFFAYGSSAIVVISGILIVLTRDKKEVV